MPRSYIALAEYPSEMVRLACTKCERRGHSDVLGTAAEYARGQKRGQLIKHLEKALALADELGDTGFLIEAR
jgi:hypothetical protein